MTKLILIDARKMEKLLLKLGLRKVCAEGVSCLLQPFDGRYTTVFHHKGRFGSAIDKRDLERN
jgi:predicted RNA binding protein YcfA (HicA-like mRNA interferase family)